MQVVFESHWDIPCNWKALAENFMESYHYASAHVKTLQPIMPARGTWTEEEKPNHIRCHLPYRAKVREEIADMESRGEQWEAFPSLKSLNDTQRHATARNGTQRHATARNGTQRHATARNGTQRHATARNGTQRHEWGLVMGYPLFTMW
ncbi:MAG: phenylpropionate dioxygenase-like ring-hydroxylating dioxygenase large terminal subunit [Verrucomicrobiales bacterium]|jgi:phenylpropionate dioxygenase-like ring-hydroxylating dioxygenase large terminal subunit